MTAIDRAGGLARLRDLVEAYADRAPTPYVAETSSHVNLILVDGGDGSFVALVRCEPVARSAAVRADQLRAFSDDEAELEPVVRRLRRELEERDLPEGERRALDGNR